MRLRGGRSTGEWGAVDHFTVVVHGGEMGGLLWGRMSAVVCV